MSSGTILSQKVSQKYFENLQKNSENEMLTKEICMKTYDICLHKQMHCFSASSRNIFGKLSEKELFQNS
jgi:hypothetical protein